MTNKVKPFFIRITDDMTPQMVQDAFDKCVDAGACAGDCVDEAKSEHEYQEHYEFGEYWLFGVADSGSTRFYDAGTWFGSDAQEITLDQLDEWLGLEVKQEWKNGDELQYMKFPHRHFFIGLDPTDTDYLYAVTDDGYVNRFLVSETKNITCELQGSASNEIPDWNGEGSPKNVEWKNGDECIYQGKPWHFVSILSDEFHGTAVIFERISEKLKQVDLSKLEKPETPGQKAERKRLEAIKEMAQTPSPCGFAIYDICEQLYDAGYRKQ